MTVELDVFSGRPNPTWQLTENEAVRLVDLLSGLPPADGSWDEGGLGYRGFIVRNAEKRKGIPAEVRVANGLVRHPAGELFQDIRRAEKYLATLAAERGHKDLVEHLLKEE